MRDITNIPLKKITRERLRKFVGKTWDTILNNLMDKAEEQANEPEEEEGDEDEY